jgi:acetoin utilization protein AcuC
VTKNISFVLEEECLKYSLGEGHPMNGLRLIPSFHLFKEFFINENLGKIQPIEPISDDLLFEVHDAGYIQTIRGINDDGILLDPIYGLGTSDCPIFKGMADISQFITESSVSSIKDIFAGKTEFGFNILGGLHHAFPAKASGFCYYNDINVAIQYLKRQKKDIKIFYLDTDLHHGDAVQDFYYNDPNVLTVSFHESGEFIFPGTGMVNETGSSLGEGYSVNLPFMPFTWDEAYLNRIKQYIPAIFESYNPDFVIWQCGADGHINDPLGHLQLTNTTYYQIGKMMRKLVLDMKEPKLLGLGGGGYNPDGVAKVWSASVFGLLDKDLPTETPNKWREICKSNGINVSRNYIEEPSKPVDDLIYQTISGNESYQMEFEMTFSNFFAI